MIEKPNPDPEPEPDDKQPEPVNAWKKLIIAAVIALAAPLAAEAQTCPDITVAYTEGDVIGVESNFLPVVTVATVVALEPCPNGTVAEAKTGLVNQIKLGVIEVNTWGGRRELVPPARVVRYILPHPGIPAN